MKDIAFFLLKIYGRKRFWFKKFEFVNELQTKPGTIYVIQSQGCIALIIMYLNWSYCQWFCRCMSIAISG